jgi:amino acid transporter
MNAEKKPIDEAIDLQAIESHAIGEMTTPSAELRRDLRPHQVFMFSIACAIGTGLVIGSGTALSRGGPASMLIAYLLIGAVVFFVMTALGEMASFAPMKKGFGGYATRMVDPAFGYSDSNTSENFVICVSLLIF